MSRTSFIVLPLLTSSFLFSANVFADSPYLSAEIGGMRYGICHETKATGRVAAGYSWDKNDSLKYGLEIGLQAAPDSNCYKYAEHISLSMVSLDVFGVLDFYFHPNFDLFAKLGIATTREKSSSHYHQYHYSDVDYNTSVEAALGIGYNIYKHLNLNLTYYYDFGNQNYHHSFAMVGLKVPLF